MFINEYKESGTTLFIGKVMRVMKKMKAELHEHRYYLEQMVERRTVDLSKRMTVLESCNATLCDKLAMSQQEAATLKEQLALALSNGVAETNDRAVKLYIVNNQTQKMPRPIVQH